MIRHVRLTTLRPMGEKVDDEGGTFLRLTPLGLVVSEHIDKIGYFEPTLTVVSKEIEPYAVSFDLEQRGKLSKSFDEILRGYRIGCFRIALGYRLITAADPLPIFAET